MGNNGGKVKKFVNIPLIVKSNSTARIQEAHIMLGHLICFLIENQIFYNNLWIVIYVSNQI